MNEERICMGCGAIVVERRRRSDDGSIRWGRVKAPGVWDMCCRSEIEDGQLVSADYHYVTGETQRTFRRH